MPYKLCTDILSTIGNTPLIKLKQVTRETDAAIYVKPEYLNPSGSIKDRIALEMIRAAESSGRIKPGDTIVEASTGNTGIALCFAGIVKGYKIKIFETLPGKANREKTQIMRNLGAEVRIIVPEDMENLREQSIAGAEIEIPGRKMCLELERNHPGVWWARQFSNEANVRAQQKTGEEILRDLDGKIDLFIASIGTGGTLMGIAEVLKNKNPDTRIIGIQPAASRSRLMLNQAVYPDTEIKGGIISRMLKQSGLIDEIVVVSDTEALGMTHRLWQEEGLFCGVSSGANVFIALKEIRKSGEVKNVVTVLPDGMDRYVNEAHFVT